MIVRTRYCNSPNLNIWKGASEVCLSVCVTGTVLTLSDAGVWRLNLGRGGDPKAPPPIRGTFSTPDPKNGSQPHNSPRLRCYNIKRTQKLHATCWKWQLFVSFCLPVATDRVPPYKTRPILTTFAHFNLNFHCNAQINFTVTVVVNWPFAVREAPRDAKPIWALPK